MLLKRLAYALTFAASLAAFIVTDSGIALFICVCLAVMPIVSIILLIFARMKFKFDFTVRDACIRGGALQITMTASLSPRFLAGYVQAYAEIENTTFHITEKKTFLFKELSPTLRVYDYVSNDAGRISVRFTKIVITDVLGICAFGIKCPKFAEAMVSPILYGDLQAGINVNQNSMFTGENSVPQKGNDITEIYNIRDYVSGDPLNSVHWKLSGKFDSLKSKDFGASYDNRTLILADLSRKRGERTFDNDNLNAVLDIAVSLSDSFKSRGLSHSVGWFNDGEFASADVYDSDSFVRMVYALMSIKVDEGNSEVLFYLSRIPEHSSFTRIILVAPTVSPEEMKNYSGAEITAVVPSDTDGEINEGSIRIITVPCATAGKSLKGRVL